MIAGIQELPDQRVGARVGVSHARQVGERLDVGLAEDVGQELQGPAAGGSARAVRDGDEPGVHRRQMADGLVQRGDAGLGSRRIHLERDRHGRSAQVDGHGPASQDRNRAQPNGRTRAAAAPRLRRCGGRGVIAGGCRARLSLLPGTPRFSGASSRTTGRRCVHGSGAGPCEPPVTFCFDRDRAHVGRSVGCVTTRDVLPVRQLALPDLRRGGVGCVRPASKAPASSAPVQCAGPGSRPAQRSTCGGASRCPRRAAVPPCAGGGIRSRRRCPSRPVERAIARARVRWRLLDRRRRRRAALRGEGRPAHLASRPG